MKKLLFVMAAFLLLGGTAMAGFIDHPNQGRIANYTSSFVQSISDLQAEFYAIHGYYFQGLWVLGDVEADGETDYPAINSTSPIFQSETWHDFSPTIFKNNAKFPINIRIDVRVTADGEEGWTLLLECFYPGLGPDDYGNDGDHWVYRYFEDLGDPTGPFEIWYILEDL